MARLGESVYRFIGIPLVLLKLVSDMYLEKRIAVVIPAYNVAHLVAKVVRTLPDFVDHAVVINDTSTDGTAQVLDDLLKDKEWADRLVVLTHEVNGGVGAAIATGYKWCRTHQVDVSAVMAGDGQMDPRELRRIIEPVADGRTDYTKGNRLLYAGSYQNIPTIRFFGNSVLSMLTKIASGYWHVTDSQSGYTAISLEALKAINLDRIYPRYGMPNDMLVKLNIYAFRVMDVPSRPVYDVGEKSGIRVRRVVFTISLLLMWLFVKRMVVKYVIYDFHPLVCFYTYAAASIPIGAILGSGLLIWSLNYATKVPTGWLLLCVILLISGLQSLFFGMWFDMDYNRDLYIFHRGQRPRV